MYNKGMECDEMIHLNIKSLRTNAQFTQEELAEKLNVSRQVIAKWEKGESTPDISNCLAISELFNVSIDDLVKHNEQETMVPIPPKGKYFFGVTTIDEKRQITLPEKACEMFHIKAGQSIIVLGDEDRGLAIVPIEYINKFLNIMKTPTDN